MLCNESVSFGEAVLTSQCLFSNCCDPLVSEDETVDSGLSFLICSLALGEMDLGLLDLVLRF